MPITPAALYLAVGIAVGPAGLHWLDLDFVRDARWLERLTEIAVVVSLFLSGMKLRLAPWKPAWKAAYLMAGPVMLLCIGSVMVLAHLLFGLPWPAALLLGAVLAPTDPVLAALVSVDDGSDEDKLRYGLTAEAGLNDGAAFPFVTLALFWSSASFAIGDVPLLLAKKLLWAIPAGLGLGFFLGLGVGHLAITIRARQRDTTAPSDFLALALIGLSYVLAEKVGAWGFLAVFAAGVGLRRAEVHTVADEPHPDQSTTNEKGDDPPSAAHPPAEELVAPHGMEEEEVEHPAVAAGVMLAESMSFGDTLGRCLEVLLVGIVGVAISTQWTWPVLPLSALLFLVVRPLACELVLRAAPLSSEQRRLSGFFGIRGIGSLYYLTYAITHGLDPAIATRLVPIVLTVVATSIGVHGLATTPIVDWYRRRQEGA